MEMTPVVKPMCFINVCALWSCNWCWVATELCGHGAEVASQLALSLAVIVWTDGVVTVSTFHSGQDCNFLFVLQDSMEQW